MDILKKVTLNNLKLNRKRSIMTILGILLSTALICAVCGMGLSGKKTFTEITKYDNGDFHVIAYNVPYEALKYVRNNANISEASVYKTLGVAKFGNWDAESLKYSAFGDTKFIAVRAFEKKALEMLSVHLIKGRMPENDSEILISEQFLMYSDEKYEIGDKLKLEIGNRYDTDGNMLSADERLHTNAYDENFTADKFKVTESFEPVMSREYSIVGIMERPVTYVQSVDSAAFTAITAEDGTEEEGSYTVAARLKDPAEFEKYKVSLALSLAGLKLVSGKTEIEINERLIAIEGGMPDTFSKVIYSMIGIIVFVIVLTSVFVIRNSFAISVQEKTRQYGMLISIGATGKQIRKSVLYEGLILGAIGVPLGLGLGVLAVLVLIRILNLLLGESIGGAGFVYSLSPVVFILTIAVSALTIFLSCLLPAIRASKIAPIVAIRSNQEINTEKNKKVLKSSKIIRKLFGMGGVIADKNLKRSRKKYRTTVVSLVISISIFIGMSSFVSYTKKAIKLNLKARDYNIELRLYDRYEQRETTDAYRKITKEYDLKKFTYSDMYLSDKGDLSSYYTDYSRQYVEKYGDDENYSVLPYVVALSSEYFEEYARSFGVKEDFDKAAILVDDYKEYENDGSWKVFHFYDIKPGTELNIGIMEAHKDEDGGASEDTYAYKKITVSASGDRHPRGFEDEGYVGGFIFVSENFFDENEKEQLSHHVGPMYVLSDRPDELEKEMKELKLGDPAYKQMDITNVEAETRNMRNLMIAVEIFLYGFITVITLIGVTNVFNTISTNIMLRRREFAMLRSVGMTGREFNRMIRLESVMYGCRSLLFGIPVGIVFSVVFYFIMGKDFGVGFLFPAGAMLISVIAVFIIVWITMKYSMGRIRNQNIIDTIRNENI